MKKLMPSAITLGLATMLFSTSSYAATDYVMYKVQKGDTMTNIARSYGVTIADIQKENLLPNIHLLKINQTLRLPVLSTNETILNSNLYSVKKGDTLYGIARAHNVTVLELQTANKITNFSKLAINQKLVIPGKVVTTPSSTYVVQKGDTLYGIAKKYNLTIAAIQQANGMGKNTTLKLKQVVNIPKPVVVTPTKPTPEPTVPAPQAPAAPSFHLPAVINGTSAESVTVSGTGQAGAEVTVIVRDTKNKTVQNKLNVSDAGTFTMMIDASSLADGMLTVEVSQKGSNGLQSAVAKKTLVKDTLAPTVVLDPAQDVVYNNQAAYEVAGSVEANSMVVVTLTDTQNHVETKTIQAQSNGRFLTTLSTSALQNGALILRVNATDAIGNAGNVLSTSIQKDDTYYVLNGTERTKWSVYADGTHPVETTKGFNDAISWFSNQGLKTFYVPAGHYMVKKADPVMWRDPSACISMAANMTFLLNDNTVIQKETNAKEAYETLCVGYGADNVTIKGGTLKGDKTTHDYSKKEDSSTPGTHENGLGISVTGAKNLVVEDVQAIEFTGDGMAIGGKGTLLQDYYDASFEPGGLDANGQPVADSTKIRMKTALSFTNPRYLDTLQKEPYFELSNAIGLPYVYTAYFYKGDGSFLSSYTLSKPREIVSIPQGATSMKAVFTKSTTGNSYAEFWNKALATNVTVKNSEFAFNRRQGITIGGADNVHITNNSFHDIKGTAPQSGIDAEGGYGENGMLNKNLFITNNEFYKNASYDLILYDGRDAVVEGNHFASKGVFGLAVSDPFTGVTVKDNHFDGSRIIAAHDVAFVGNTMNDSLTSIDGPRISFDGMTFTNSDFSVSPTVADGVSIQNITTYNSMISVWRNPVHMENITMYGPKAGMGGSALGNVITNLKIYNYSLAGMSMSPGTYTQCVIESATGSIPAGASGINLNQTGTYLFDGCQVKTSGVGFNVNNKNTDVTLLNSTVTSNSTKSLFTVLNAKSLRLENNQLTTAGITYGTDGIVVIGDYWKRNDVYDPAKQFLPSITIKGNMLTNTSSTTVNGLVTSYAGIGAPVYTVDNNVLHKATLKLKTNDTNVGNQELAN